ncbi:hypothetical protein A9Q99_23605 [Gammaproteobacteria bacterium 45_16_T64]|nr:hypothetical protein A9Q99_23605 [Gammaproteobacteria bacterium 45_16_T64]
MKLLQSVFSILLLTLSTMLFAADKISPETVTGATTVNASEAKALFDQGVLFVDVRKDKDWNAGRIPDALHLNVKTLFNAENLLKEIKKTDPVVVYCNGPSCMRSSKAAKMTVEWGFTKVNYFRGGLPAWKAAGYSVE